MKLVTGRICVGDEMLFLTSWPSGKLEVVTILGFKNKKGVYITRASGGTDSTVKDFLFHVPENYRLEEE